MWNIRADRPLFLTLPTMQSWKLMLSGRFSDSSITPTLFLGRQTRPCNGLAVGEVKFQRLD